MKYIVLPNGATTINCSAFVILAMLIIYAISMEFLAMNRRGLSLRFACSTNGAGGNERLLYSQAREDLNKCVVFEWLAFLPVVISSFFT